MTTNNCTESDRLYDDIRPYRDSEVEGVLRNLHQIPDFEKNLRVLMNSYISFYSEEEKDKIILSIAEKIKTIKSVEEFQREIVLKYMLQPVIDNTIDTFTFSGFDTLSENNGYLFIGNHRDITLDPALLNYVLYIKGIDSVEIAFGDNLLINDFITAMIRLNRSFIVRRNLPLSKQLESATRLSGYINHVLELGRSVWIAQREGRAKDGNDTTNPAIISMLHLSRRGNIPLAEFIENIRIVPVAVSYEFDPCDRLKALEILKIKNSGNNEKSSADDLISMNRGITGYKGRVHYSAEPSFGITGATEKDIAAALDRAIQLSYHLWPINYLAFDRISSTSNYRSFYTASDEEILDKRINRLTPEIKSLILRGYANPVKNFELMSR